MALVNQGRQDWQRTATSDSTALLNLRNQGEVGTITWGPFNVASFATLAGIITLHGGGWVRFDVSYFSDQAGTIFLGTRRFALDSATATTCQLSHRCLGPWATITAQPLNAGTAWNLDFQLAAVDRFTELMFTPLDGLLVSVQNALIGAGGQLTVNIAELFAGPAMFGIASNAVNVFWAVQTQRASGVWDYIAQEVPAGGALDTRPIVLPPYPTRLVINNTDAAAHAVYGAVVASLTGST